MNLDDRGRASTRALLGSVSRVDAAAGLEDLLRRRRRRLVAKTATAIATVTALVLVAWVVARGPSRPTTVAQPAGSLGRVTASIRVGAGPIDVVAGEGAVWVANATQGTVSRIDPATNTVTQTTPVGRNPVRLAAGLRSIWVANQAGRTVARLEALTGLLHTTIPVTGRIAPEDLAVGVGMLWVRSGDRLLSLDPATNTMTDRTGDWEVGGGGTAVVDGLLWLSGATRSGAGQIVRVDPSTSRVIDRFTTPGDGALAVGGGSVWQAGSTTQTIYRYDPTSKRRLARIPIGVVAKHLTADADSLWVSSDSGSVTRIDMATSKVTGTFQVGGRGSAVAVGHGAVWIVDTANAALLRIQPTA
jgi:YVTN family beta-propeller protein